MRNVGIVLCSALVACASSRPLQQEQALTFEERSHLERECTEDTVIVLCDAGECWLYRCREVAPSLAWVRRLRHFDGAHVVLPGDIDTFPLSTATSSSHVGGGPGLVWANMSRTQEPGGFGEGDVIRQIVRLQKPGTVVDWWVSEPKRKPEKWSHPLSRLEKEYLKDMSAPTVPESVRMWPAVEAEHLTPWQAREAERILGRGPFVAQGYANLENRRRIINHYVMTHPATIRLSLSLYRILRDTNPLHFALERGWQMASGKEMFTRREVSKLGAAEEFFAALAVAVATEAAVAVSEGEQSVVARQHYLSAGRTECSVRPRRRQGRSFGGHRLRASLGWRTEPLSFSPPSARMSEPPRSTSPRGSGEPSAGMPGGKGAAPSLKVIQGGAEVGELAETEIATLKFRELEQEVAEARIAGNLEDLIRLRPSKARPPGGVELGDPLWEDYVRYYDKRLAECLDYAKGGVGEAPESPLTWSGYKITRNRFERGNEFELRVRDIIEGEARLPPEQREFTQGIQDPRVDTNMGVYKAGNNNTKYVDHSIFSKNPTGPGEKPQCVVVSDKSVDFRSMPEKEVEATVRKHYSELLTKYGGNFEVRRPSHPFFGREVEAKRMHLVYDKSLVLDKQERSIVDLLREKPVQVHFK